MLDKIIFWISISLLVFWILTPIILSVFGLELNNDEFEQLLAIIRFWTVPICVFLVLCRILKPNDNKEERIAKVILILGVTVFSFFFMVMTIFVGMCDWTNREILYTNIQNEKVRIIARDYGCGAFDSDLSVVQNFRVQELGKYFIWTKEINIEEIDKAKWKKN